jgi:hypothetical protein
LHTLHLVSVSGPDELGHVRAVLNAMRGLHGDDNVHAQDADRAITTMKANGNCLLGEHADLEYMAQLQILLDESGVGSLIDYAPEPKLTPEEAFGNPPAEPDYSVEPADPEGPAVADATAEATERPVFSDAAYETAMALLVANDGNPLHAASSGFTLGRSTGNAELYAETINAIIFVFPHVGEILRDNGLLG